MWESPSKCAPDSGWQYAALNSDPGFNPRSTGTSASRSRASRCRKQALAFAIIVAITALCALAVMYIRYQVKPAHVDALAIEEKEFERKHGPTVMVAHGIDTGGRNMFRGMGNLANKATSMLKRVVS